MFVEAKDIKELAMDCSSYSAPETETNESAEVLAEAWY